MKRKEKDHDGPVCVLTLLFLFFAFFFNSFATVPGQEGLFSIAARFNHACHPADNITYTYDPSLSCLVMSVLAERIPAGEELTISYGSHKPSTLYLWYGFRCRCGACPGMTDEEVRRLENSIW